LGRKSVPTDAKGTFKVVRIDLHQGVADLEYTTGTHYVEKNIPFEAIVTVPDNDEAPGSSK